MLVVAVSGTFVLDLPVEHVGAHGKLPLSSADILIESVVDGLVHVCLTRADARRAHPLQGPRQVHSLVLVLHECGNEGLEEQPARPLVDFPADSVPWYTEGTGYPRGRGGR